MMVMETIQLRRCFKVYNDMGTDSKVKRYIKIKLAADMLQSIKDLRIERKIKRYIYYLE